MDWARAFSRWFAARPLGERGGFVACVAAACLAFTLAGGAMAHIADRYDLFSKARARLALLFDRAPPNSDQIVAWRSIETSLEELQLAWVEISPHGAPALAAIAEVGDDIVFTSRLGRFGYETADNHIRPLDLHLPMNLDRLRASGLEDDPYFEIMTFRVTDLLSVETGPGRYDLYAAYQRFGEDCVKVVVSRIALEARDGGLHRSGAWSDVYVAHPCVPIDHNAAPRIAGYQGGGRLALLDRDTLLLSVGDFAFDGYTKPAAVSMDPESDLGKLLAISLSTGRARHFASGLRNPEGLLVAHDGRIWETEHGPQGGDELNLMRDGANYGWPIVTYGTQYTHPPLQWPANPTPGAHDGYVRPRFAFVPSIAISNLVEPDVREFPNWGRRLLVGSLSQQKLFVLAMDGDEVVYAEPIEIGARIRDMISLHDGRIALITDNGFLVFLRRDGGDAAPLHVDGLSSLSAPVPEEREPTTTALASVGSDAYVAHCQACHSLHGVARVGPPLNGLIGRRIGAAPGFSYSRALAEKREVWTPELLSSFLQDPQDRFPGTIMPPPHLTSHETHQIIDYLRAGQAQPQHEQQAVH
ncbi:MAG: PQQ-dependent sugar dehydrogenase [Hyphomonadaceae bacterium]|nr:PQQ-dependent sugar dehydrogenase [Hyphomonadaceae bacterium]